METGLGSERLLKNNSSSVPEKPSEEKCSKNSLGRFDIKG
jgi:hypothetical protein